MWRTIVTLAALLAAVALAAVTTGCSKTTNQVRGNQRPVIRLTQAPVDSGEVDPRGDRLRYFYAYRMNWSSYDPDGRVDHYLYAIDPPDAQQASAGADTQWVRTENQEETIFFRASVPDPGDNTNQSSEFHTFVIKALDNRALASEPVSRSFYNYTVAPTVNIRFPSPSTDVPRIVSPSVLVTWEGTDVDGQLTQRPVRYLYRLFTQLGGVINDPETNLALFAEQQPRAFRDSMIAAGFPGFRSTPAESAFAQYTDLVPTVTRNGDQISTRNYLFVVVAVDEAGAYNAEWGRSSNMLKLSVGFAAGLGPTFAVFNQYVQFVYPGPGFGYDDRNCSLLDVEVPAYTPIRWNWGAAPTPGATIRGYRWALDLDDPFNEDARTNEITDLYHWSQLDPGTVFCDLPAFGPGRHELKIEAVDNNGLKSSACVRFTCVPPLFDPNAPDPTAPILIVDDTRFEVDRYNGRTPADTIPRPYSNRFPSASELDTLLYAVGGVPIQRLQTGRPPANSRPGVFHGFRFDTLGTRLGLENVTRTVPLSRLLSYPYVIWLVDNTSASFVNPGTDRNSPITTLRYISTPGRANALATYFGAGGRLWLAGGGAAEASSRPWRGLPGRPAQPIVEGIWYSSLPNREMGPGRLMFDVAGWQNEFVTGFTQIRPLKHARAGWRTYPGSPNVSLLPQSMRVRAQGQVPPEELPARRSEFDNFYNEFNSQGVEYLSAGFDLSNAELEPLIDTLMVLDKDFGLIRGDLSAPSYVVPAMTFYHPEVGGTCVMTGFAPWDFLHADQRALVEFVLLGVWGVSPVTTSTIARSGTPAAHRPATAPLTPAQRTTRSGLPALPTGGRR